MRWPILLLLLFLLNCQKKAQPETVLAEEALPAVDLAALGNATLTSYQFFKGNLRELEPVNGVWPYAINSALFSDYAFKKRFIKIPQGKKIKYHHTEVFDFPEGTILIKNFYYPADFRKPEEERRILETRLLLLEGGSWKALPYVWNEEQTEAYLEVSGKSTPVSWTGTDGILRNINYSIPSINQCKGCHLKGDKVMPIGPSARQLNKTNAEGSNQLTAWKAAGILEELPELSAVPKLASYDDTHESLDLRARAWLEINCAHCHRPDGQAKTSGLHLMADIQSPMEIGIGKAPVAAGKGSGGRLYGIVPGRPEESIMLYRIESTHPGIMMPEIGRTIAHDEGVALVREWIAKMR